MQPLVLSVSSVTSYLRCGQRWAYENVYRYPARKSVKQSLGVAVHKAAEVDLSQKIDTRVDLPEADMVDAFADSYEQERSDTEGTDHELDKGKDTGVKLTKLYAGKVAPQIMPAAVEEQFQYQVGGIEFSGYLDVRTEDDRIRDLKSTRQSPGQTNLLQLTGLAVGFRQKHGRKERGVGNDYLVAKTHPEFIPRHQGTVTDNQIATWSQIVSGVAEDIERGIFRPNGMVATPSVCGYCPFTDRCPAYKGQVMK